MNVMVLLMLMTYYESDDTANRREAQDVPLFLNVRVH